MNMQYLFKQIRVNPEILYLPKLFGFGFNFYVERANLAKHVLMNFENFLNSANMHIIFLQENE